MFRSLQLKLVLIMVLLIISIMAVVGTFLINSVAVFHLEEFSDQMARAFSENAEFVSALRSAAGEEDAVTALRDRLAAYGSYLGIDLVNRNFYVLDGQTGAFLAGSDEASGKTLSLTPNIYTAMNGGIGDARSFTSTYIDVAIPVSGGEGGPGYIVCIMDNKLRTQALTGELFTIILESLLFGIAISVVLSFLLSKTMTSPIEELTKSAQRLGKGEYEGGIEVYSRDEIGTLTNTFNDMAKTLHDTLEAVENERNKLTTLFLHMTDGVAAFTRAGLMIHMNPAAEELLGAEEAGNPSYDTLFGETFPLDEALKLRPPTFHEAEVSREGRILKLSFAPFGESESGGEGGLIIVIHDITEQAKLENVRREFVANVSHELRTPLTNVKSYAETLIETEGIDRETEQNFLSVILSESDRMTRIVSDLLTLSQFDYDRAALHPEWCRFTRILERVYEAMHLEAKKHGHTMTLEIPSALPDIFCDRGRIEQVLINVIANAVKYTPDGGVIEILAGRDADGARVWVSVSDNGIGIPKADQARLFERFYRVDKARARAYGGSGLGLAIAKEIIERHGGSILVDSAPGRGTTVTVRLPEKPDFQGGEEEAEAPL
ncbi:cell wall metabolism sensor histidine kinase WalK [Oscillospiraceae bacterium OttesenSCG-928-F05]|nr:cell wall metabolism sensor histidine kinase WalK [Oscillospiraceae bacterium OttesenSCG-928-F05]